MFRVSCRRLVVACLTGLLTAGLLPPCHAQQPVQGGNAVLMEDWVRKKTELRDRILDKLRNEGRLPKDGSFEFSARIKPDTTRKDQFRIQLDRFERHGENDSAKLPEVTKPGDTATPSASVPFELHSDVPKHVHGRIDFRDGRVERLEIAPESAGISGGGVAMDSLEDRKPKELMGNGNGGPVPGAGMNRAQNGSDRQERKAEDRSGQEPKNWWQRLLGF